MNGESANGESQFAIRRFTIRNFTFGGALCPNLVFPA